MRRASRTDDNQSDIVKDLRKIPGISVCVGHDDILVGYCGDTYWFEIKRPAAISKRTGYVKASEITPSEQDRLDTWRGHYSIAWKLDQVLQEIGFLTND